MIKKLKQYKIKNELTNLVEVNKTTFDLFGGFEGIRFFDRYVKIQFGFLNVLYEFKTKEVSVHYSEMDEMFDDSDLSQRIKELYCDIIRTHGFEKKIIDVVKKY